MKPTIRLATAYDIDAIYEIEKLCFDNIEQFDKNFFYLFLMRRNYEIFYVATIDENQRSIIVGFIIAFLNKKGNYEIATVNVHPNFRNQGIGFQLMIELENAIRIITPELIKTKKIPEDRKNIVIELTVYDKNNSALSLYKKLDYHKIKFIPNYYKTGKDGIRMIKNLNIR